MPGLPTVIALCVALTACAARPTVVSAPTAPIDFVETLRHDLQAIFGHPSVDHAHWGVRVDSLSARETLFRLNAQHLLVPASSQKLLTAATAAERLGWDFRFTTRLRATGPITADGVLDGDLVVVGSGDPTINPRHPDRWGAFDAWALELGRLGLRTIRGHLIGDDDAFAEPGWGAGWAWDDLAFGYGAQTSALQFHENEIDVVVGPGMAEGAPAIIGTTPIGGGIFVANAVVTAPAGTQTQLDFTRVPGSTFLDVSGRIPLGAKPTSFKAAVENPTRFYVHAMRDALARHGITIDGQVADIDELTSPPDTQKAVDLLVDYSPPLSEIVDVTLKWSRNIYAETLLFAMAPRGEPATDGQGLDLLKQTLGSWGVPDESYLPRDGSGLSRYDLLSADALTVLLEHVALDARHTRFRTTLPVAGVSGTLATRLRGTAAEGRVFAKTGSMSGVRTLSGYVTTLDDETLIVSILVNNYRLPASAIEALVDRALVRLVEFSRGSSVSPPPSVTAGSQ
ncbi:MAG: D-alanyl-D-alanine carboxypeptidase/D-alanyl-D-alanine endopeptidase [Acidobacteriota bacterium]